MTTPEQTALPVGEQLLDKVSDLFKLIRDLKAAKQSAGSGHEQFVNALSLLGQDPTGIDHQVLEGLQRIEGLTEIALEAELYRTKAELLGKEVVARELAIRAFTNEHLLHRTIAVRAIGERAIIDMAIFRKPLYSSTMDYYREAKVNQARGEFRSSFDIQGVNLTLYAKGARGQREQYIVPLLDGDANPQVTVDVV